MKRMMVLAILSLTMSFSAAAQVTNTATPFVVQPASSFQPFQATAPFYINSPHQTPVFVPNPPYNAFEPAQGPEPQQPQAVRPAQNRDAEAQTLREKPSPPAPPAVLALRNGAVLEAQSYAIAGDTIWMSSGTESRRIKTADLDVPKTQRLNQQRGIQFSLPH